MLHSEIFHDRKVLELSTPALVAWIAIILTADDEGIIEPDARALFYAMGREDMTVADVRKALEEITAQRLVVHYGEDGEYAFIPSWFKHQRLAHPTDSRRPLPPVDVLEEHPDYVEGRNRTFGRKGEPAAYPYERSLRSRESSPVDSRQSSATSEGSRTDTPSEPVPEEDSRVNSPVTEESGEDSRKFAKVRENSRAARTSIGKVRLEEKNNIAHADGAITGPPVPIDSEGNVDLSSIAGVEDDKALYRVLFAEFQSRQPGERFSNYAKEGKATKGLIEKARALYADDPGDFLRMMLAEFQRLRRSGDKFWKGQPYLPSALNASGIWDRVLHEAQSRYESYRRADDLSVEEIPF